MELLRIEYQDKTYTVRLNRGVTNALNLELIRELTEILNKFKKNPAAQGLILIGSNEKFFSIGFDIPQLFGLTESDFKTFYKSYNQLCLNLYTLPKPTIAAITGHAIAGGCILALCCDYRFIAQGRKLMGFNEIKLGVPVPYPADCILRQIVGSRYARYMIDTGDFYQPEQLFQMGLVDEVLPTDQVLSKSITKIKLLANSSLDAFSIIKRNRVETVEAHILDNLAEKERLFLKYWYSDKSRKRLKEAIEKF